MIENSSITSESDTKAVMSNEAAEDGLLKLQLEDSEIPEISIDGEHEGFFFNLNWPSQKFLICYSNKT